MGQVARIEVVEYTDSLCSWVWGRNRSCGCAAGATRTVATGELERYAFPTLLFWGNLAVSTWSPVGVH